MTDTPTPAQQHVETLRRMRENCTGFAHLADKHAALDYALAALEAVEKMRAWAHELRTFKEVGVAGATAYKIAGEVLAALPPADAVEVK